MNDFQSIFNSYIKEAFSFKRYSIFTWWFRIIIIILMLPLILSTVSVAVFYQILIFLFKLFQAPSKYIKHTIDENQVAAAPLFVVYLIAYPYKFTLDLMMALNMISLSIIHFVFVTYAYLMSFGGVKYQPYLFEAKTEVSKEKPTFRLNVWVQLGILIAIIGLVSALIIAPIIKDKINTERYMITEVSGGVQNYIIDYQVDEFDIIAVYYFDTNNYNDFSIVRIKHDGADYFLRVYRFNYRVVYEVISVNTYSNLKENPINGKMHKLDSDKLEKYIIGNLG